uniref:Uncharacterized protein n=1 Tax=Rhizophora mucronata TaxID=61149 RepID=A0A2P2R5B6_RHIMU
MRLMNHYNVFMMRFNAPCELDLACLLHKQVWVPIIIFVSLFFKLSKQYPIH